MSDQQTTPSIGEQIGGAIGQEVGKAVGKEVENHFTGQSADKKKKKGKSPAARRVGYAIGIAFGFLFLWIVGNVDDWGWKFITDEWSQMEGLIRTSIIIDLVTYGVFLIADGKVLYYLGKLVSNAFSFFVGIRMFQVFPFDFNELFGGWGWLNTVAPILIILGLVALGIALVVRTVKLAAGKEIYD